MHGGDFFKKFVRKEITEETYLKCNSLEEVIGKRVQIKKNTKIYSNLIGKKGIARCISDRSGKIGVEFDEQNIIMHTCRGNTLSNKGFWVSIENLKILDDEEELHE